MKNSVYYGEYSLEHWIDLVLNKKIELPEYQRCFVWEKSDIEKLINTLKERRFVPPITIGAYKDGTQTRNLIIDGQQRLTALLLARIKKFPNRSWRTAESEVAESDDSDSSDDYAEEAEEAMEFDPIKWNVNKLLPKESKTIESIAMVCSSDKYESMDTISVDDNFWKENFIGFCYLIPGSISEDDQQRYFSATFRDMNICGHHLSEQDSRRSLYYLKKGLDKLFEPDFAKSVTLHSNSKIGVASHMDFVRYLALISNYIAVRDYEKVARGRKKTFEKFIEEYIAFVVNKECDNGIFAPFATNVDHVEWMTKLKNLSDAVVALEIEREYASIIDMDAYVFGLVYWIFFEAKFVDVERASELKNTIERTISGYKSTAAHKRSPALLKYLRQRMNDSISVYKNYLCNE